MDIKIDNRAKHSLYKQIVEQVERGIRDGSLQPGDQLPSMNALAERYDISRETVKNAYGILVEKSLIEPRHGKGFYIKDITAGRSHTRVLMVFDKFSVYKQMAFDAFVESMPADTDITIRSHDQNPDQLEYLLDSYLDDFDYYVIAPHFPTDEATQKRVVKLLERVPVRKLLLVDHLQPGLRGNFGAIYQDFENDIYESLCENFSNSSAKRLKVITLPMSMYGDKIRIGVQRFASEHRVDVEFMTSIPDIIESGDAFIVLNSQLDAGLVTLAKKIQTSGLEIGKGVFIISYNEFPMNELILGGLTTVSTDFPGIGQTAAQMLMSRKMKKIHNRFLMIRRRTF
ncbi:MAG: GntR family transcriptional regulator [Bacteroidales bacterium]|nr:GntR family transcriptional regulator [Bacteroidales bacterium]